MLYQTEKDLALNAVKIASQLCEGIRGTAVASTFAKADQSPVTMADFGAQAVICQAIASVFPDDPIIAEENAQILRSPASQCTLDSLTSVIQEFLPQASSEAILDWIDRGNGTLASRYWTLDPIDGTKGFIRGDQYAIALALVEEGEVKLGILGCPLFPWEESTGVLFLAVQGQGTIAYTLEGTPLKPLHVNPIDDPTLIQIVQSVEFSHSDRGRQEALAETLAVQPSPFPMDSQAKYGAIAQGQADLYVRIPLPQNRDRRENIWDHAAGCVVVTEAGGRVTDLDGKPLNFSLGAKLQHNRGILASNGAIHDSVLTAIQQLGI